MVGQHHSAVSTYQQWHRPARVHTVRPTNKNAETNIATHWGGGRPPAPKHSPQPIIPPGKQKHVAPTSPTTLRVKQHQAHLAGRATRSSATHAATPATAQATRQHPFELIHRPPSTCPPQSSLSATSHRKHAHTTGGRAPVVFGCEVPSCASPRGTSP